MGLISRVSSRTYRFNKKMLRFTKNLAFSNKKSLMPRGYWPIGRKFKPQPFNIYKPDKGDDYEFNNGIPTAMSLDLYGALSTAKPDIKNTNNSRTEVVNSKIRKDMGVKVIDLLSEMNDARDKFTKLEQGDQLGPRRRRRTLRKSLPTKSYKQTLEEV